MSGLKVRRRYIPLNPRQKSKGGGIHFYNRKAVGKRTIHSGPKPTLYVAKDPEFITIHYHNHLSSRVAKAESREGSKTKGHATSFSKPKKAKKRKTR
jgi:hypothetical protein